jgi:hypothetical protein
MEGVTISLTDGQENAVYHHRRWYDRFSAYDRLARWEGLLREQPEAAVCEAMVREELEQHVDVVFPREDVSTGGPDFQCFQKQSAGQQHFYVEATCLTSDSVTRATHLDPHQRGPAYHHLLTERFRDECRGKSKQLSGLDAPALLAIATLHGRAGSACFNEAAAKFILTSETRITQNFDPATGAGVGEIYLSTNMRKSAFQRPVKEMPWVLEDASRSVSGILLCPFGGSGPYSIVGVVHPNAVRPFDPEWLPRVAMFSVREQQGGLDVFRCGSPERDHRNARF